VTPFASCASDLTPYVLDKAAEAIVNDRTDAMVQTIIELEEQGWQSLSSGTNDSLAFYDRILRSDAVMLFPGGLILEGKKKILDSLAAQPWKTFRMEKPQVVSPTQGVGVLFYRVTAQRQSSMAYTALISSTYVLEDGTWKLVFHQHTPVA
jgi:hypothetical protein